MSARVPVSARVPALSLAVLAVLLVSACADEDRVTVTPVQPGGSGAEQTTPAPATPVAPRTPAAPSTPAAPAGPLAAQLTVTVDDGAGGTTTHTLTCEPVGGDVPDPQAACDAVAAAGIAAFQPLPADQMCTMIFGGPQTATAAGTLGGAPVAATFSRSNGCEIDRWNSLEALLGSVDS